MCLLAARSLCAILIMVKPFENASGGGGGGGGVKELTYFRLTTTVSLITVTRLNEGGRRARFPGVSFVLISFLDADEWVPNQNFDGDKELICTCYGVCTWARQAPADVLNRVQPASLVFGRRRRRRRQESLNGAFYD